MDKCEQTNCADADIVTQPIHKEIEITLVDISDIVLKVLAFALVFLLIYILFGWGTTTTNVIYPPTGNTLFPNIGNTEILEVYTFVDSKGNTYRFAANDVQKVWENITREYAEIRVSPTTLRLGAILHLRSCRKVSLECKDP